MWCLAVRFHLRAASWDARINKMIISFLCDMQTYQNKRYQEIYKGFSSQHCLLSQYYPSILWYSDLRWLTCTSGQYVTVLSHTHVKLCSLMLQLLNPECTVPKISGFKCSNSVHVKIIKCDMLWYIYIHTHTHTHTYMYIYVNVKNQQPSSCWSIPPIGVLSLATPFMQANRAQWVRLAHNPAPTVNRHACSALWAP